MAYTKEKYLERVISTSRAAGIRWDLTIALVGMTNHRVQILKRTLFSADKETRLTPELPGTLWVRTNEKYYGGAEMTERYRQGWSYILAFTVTVTSSASYWSSRFIESTVSKQELCAELISESGEIASPESSQSIGCEHPRPISVGGSRH